VRTSHRVVNRTNGARCSIPSSDKAENALATRPPTCVDDAYPPKDQPMTYGYKPRKRNTPNLFGQAPVEAPSQNLTRCSKAHSCPW
jgi:hypothetical protein